MNDFRRVRTRLFQVVATAWVLLAYSACNPPPPNVTLVEMDLAPCLGLAEGVTPRENAAAAPVPSTCRDSLTGLLEDTSQVAVNTCLVVRTEDGEQFRVGFLFDREEGRLGRPQSDIALPPGRSLDVALFFLRTGGTAAVCDSLDQESGCDESNDCALKLFQGNVTPNSSGTTKVFFAENGLCQSVQAPALADESLEICDGKDNNCNGIIDEGYREGDRSAPFLEGRCALGTGGCRREGRWQCDQAGTGFVCDAVIGDPADEVCNDDNPIDDDCDGVTDEDLPCFVCDENRDCAETEHPTGAFCIGQRCAECDPGTPEHAGCSESQLCCATDGVPGCVEVTPEQCTECNTVEAGVTVGAEGSCGTDANACQNRECICENQGAACNASAPICDGGNCIQCRDNADCGQDALCCDNLCVVTEWEFQCESCNTACDPNNSDRCEARTCVCGDTGESCGEARLPFCDQQRELEPSCQGCRDDDDCDGGSCVFNPDANHWLCVECTTDNNCVGHPNGSQCVNSECKPCDPDDPSFAPCDPRGLTPVCKLNNVGEPQCVPCERDIECGDNPLAVAPDFLHPNEPNPVRMNFCVGGRCRVCDTDDDNGCSIPTRPICSPRNDVEPNGDDSEVSQYLCRGCQADAECGELGNCIVNEGRCTGCRPEDDQGCLPLSGTPICDPVLISCVGCTDDAQCPAGQDVQGSPRNLCVVLDPAIGGSCRECDSRDNRGCALGSDRPFCDGSGVCRACDVTNPDGGDSECALHSNVRRECVAGRCEVCDIEGNSGCDLQSNSPICRPDNTCGVCINDAECRRGLPAAEAQLTFCEDGRCVGCEQGTNAGCDPSGPLPICSNEGQCRPCNAGECPNNGECVQGRCLECDPGSHAGCLEDAERPICSAAGTCIACQADLDCLRRPGPMDQCIGGRCRECNPANDQGCSDITPVCDARRFECRGCGEDNECNDGVCIPGDGLCSECDPATHRPCDINSNTPFCDAADRECRACRDDSECPFAGTERCVQGFCRECDFRDHQECDDAGEEPICGFDGSCRPCQNRAECILRGATGHECIDGQCVECDPSDNAGCDTPNAPICRGNPPSCQACADDAECPGETVCAPDGQCVGCDPGDPNACPANSPVCDANDRTCRACRDASECAGECVNGRCEDCNPVTNVGCDLAAPNPICSDESRCVACENNAECAIFGQGLDYCVNGRCRACDPGDAASCDTEEAPVCRGNFVCGACNANNPCPGGQECVGGQCHECAPGGAVPHAGCDPTNPICDEANDGVNHEPLTCRECNRDVECGDDECVDGRCEACDPADNDGCDDGNRPVCSAATKTCRACQNNAECQLIAPGRPVCDGQTGRCVECVAEGNTGCEGGTPICNPVTNTCEPCEGVGQGNCGQGRQCVNGSCSGCNPQDNSGCDSENPVCDPNTFTCGPCRIDDDCSEGVCVEGACVACNVENNAGCGAEQLCCQQNNRPVCVDTSPDGSCEACGSQCDADAANQCGARTCNCGGQAVCAGNTPFCVGEGAAGRCVSCRNNGDCVASSDRPFCDPGSGTCVGCAGDSSRCQGNPNGGTCVTAGEFTDRCRACDPGRASGLNGCAAEGFRPICGIANDQPACLRCSNDAVCAGNPNGETCVTGGFSRGACRECDPFANFGETTCDVNSNTPICAFAASCAGCNADADCQSSERGPSCLESGACGCTDGGDCDPNSNQPICGAGGACTACQADGDCADSPRGQGCLGNGACGCADDTHCDAGSDRPTCGGGGTCVACDNNGDCAANANGRVCTDSGACGCEEDNDCGDDLTCNMGVCQ